MCLFHYGQSRRRQREIEAMVEEHFDVLTNSGEKTGVSKPRHVCFSLSFQIKKYINIFVLEVIWTIANVYVFPWKQSTSSFMFFVWFDASLTCYLKSNCLFCHTVSFFIIGQRFTKMEITIVQLMSGSLWRALKNCFSNAALMIKILGLVDGTSQVLVISQLVIHLLYRHSKINLILHCLYLRSFY